eukprot:GAFH01003467.1.p1 GENE.GAFH01003467.1~~GAFH01003467.1.p1  ORF type:complete len:303 (+),score=48.02 GAFH01003467.1:137-910(+)
MKVAFVGYRDICDGSQRFVVHDFDEPAIIAKLMETIEAAGGGDEAEDVIGGLEKVAALNWTGDIRQLIHITDAPAHGMQFHGPDVGDDHPAGLPGQNPAQTLAQLHAKRIRYKMVLAQPQLMMLKAFRGMFEQERDHVCILTNYRVKHDMSDLMSIFTQASSASIFDHRSGVLPVISPPAVQPVPVVAENRPVSVAVPVPPVPPVPTGSLVVNATPVPRCPVASTYGVTTPAPPRASMFIRTPPAPACPPTSDVHRL